MTPRNTTFFGRGFLAGVSGLLLILVACGGLSVTALLELAVAAAETAVNSLAATNNIPPDVAARWNVYLSQTTGAISFAAAELASTDTPAQKAAAITGKFAGIAAPDLTGVPQSVAVLLTAVSKTVADFLAGVQSTTAAILSHPELVSAFADNNAPHAKKLTVSDGDKKRLAKVKQRADALAQKIKR